jgi:hypothetical protein
MKRAERQPYEKRLAMTTDQYPSLHLRDLPPGRLDARKEHLLAEITREQPDLSFPRFLVSRRRGAVLVLAGTLVVIGTAAATTVSWLTGRPAPPAVVRDFGTYAPQLGFHPQPGRAVLVAEDSNISLYATTNDEGSYCLVVSAPWKRPETLPDGGTCIPAAQAAAPLIAGLLGASSPPGEERSTYLIAGRTDTPRAHTIRFTDPAGETITRTIGSSGFFVASVQTESGCPSDDWKPTFIVLGANGEELTRATITLAKSLGHGVCQFTPPHP